MKTKFIIERRFEVHKKEYCLNVGDYYNDPKNLVAPYIWVSDVYTASKNIWKRKYRHPFMMRKLLNKSQDPIIKQIIQDFDKHQPIPQPK